MLEKQGVFKVLSYLLPFLLILLIEYSLRLLGYGHDTSLFVHYPADRSKLVMNRYASEPFFSDTINATKGYYEPFDEIKQPGALRIFVLGESTAAGYPYFHNGSFHRWLAYRLMHTFPNRKIEIINLALTAVNSYTVLNFGRQVINYHPDAVLVYVGHNEYYGALGVGSTSRIGSNRPVIEALLWLRRFRTVQLIQNTLFSLQSHGNGPQGVNLNENLMKRMAGKQQIPFNGEDYKKGINQFKVNIEELAALFSKSGIPLFISTLVSNEKNLKPFVSTAATNKYSAVREFEKGNEDLKSINNTDAKKHFVFAKEYDELRFRAPEAMNEIIMHVGRRPNVYIVDTKLIFEDHSANGIIGSETLLEHVHPNLFGYALISDGFYEALNKAGILRGANEKMPFKDLLLRMPITKVDSLFGSYQIMMLKAGWPFNQPIPTSFHLENSLEAQIAGPLAINKISWATAMNQLFQQSMAAGDKRTALKATEAVMLENPENTTYYIYAARLNYELGNAKDAAFYFSRCYEIDPSYQNAQSLYMLYLKLDKPEEALQWLKVVDTKNGMNTNYQPLLALVNNLVQAKKELTEKPQQEQLHSHVADYYEKLGEVKLAKIYRQYK